MPIEDYRDMAAQASRLYRKRQYEAAFQIYLRLHEDGYTGVQTIIGWMYDRGRGVGADIEQAEWFYRAAEKYDATGESTFRLGRLYEKRGHLNEASELYARVVSLDYMPAAYRRSIVTEKTYGKFSRDSRDWLEIASKSGHIFARLRKAIKQMKMQYGPIGFVRIPMDVVATIFQWIRIAMKDSYDWRVVRT